MNLNPHTPSAAARERMLSLPHEPLLVADWLRVVMIHLEVDPEEMQVATPYPLDLWEGRAFVTLVAFSLRGMRPRMGGRVGALGFKPLASHEFLNVRTYVQYRGEPGIHFLAEWLNSRLAVQLGPRVFGLPYRFGRMEYANESVGTLHGRVEDVRSGASLEYHGARAKGTPVFVPCAAGSLDEWLMERYTAFNGAGGRRSFFRVWHEPWPQARVQVALTDRSLLAQNWPCLREAKLIAANHSPGVRGVWMGWSHRLQNK